jgi:hypothetical protein
MLTPVKGRMVLRCRIENDAPGFANSEKKAWNKGLIASGLLAACV